MYELTQLVAAMTARNVESQSPHDHLKLQVHFNEIYNGDAYELLADGANSFVREDGYGKVQFRSETSVDRPSGHDRRRAVCDCRSPRHGGAGNSNVHRTSSQSHSLVQLELVTDRVLALRTAVTLKEAELGRCGFERDALDMNIFVRQHNKNEGKWVKKADAMASTPEECATLLHLCKQYVVLESEIAAVQAAVEEAIAQGLPGLGGALVFVDLAGSEHGGRVTDGI
ncbi:Aste57867_9439 [Aphanomyces stellatus]|uniref:Aste57867_9439 protein n=1 Tax=Aphanomyces stellatus TaxID=120398 RepID=A0A485KMW2_9STRA|nr:hypothetical protein As57867_009403 [Aphanomyces stellatus]VFT86319.1 Aste57867_9439 [Aphanomyces stellatus]